MDKRSIERKAIILLLIVNLLVTALFIVIPKVSASTGCFPDTNGHWAETFICWMYDNGLTGGYPDGTYKPENNVTRAEMSVLMKNSYDLVEANDNDTLGSLSCSTDQVAKWNGSAWECRADLSGSGTDTLGDLTCTTDQIAKWNGSAWVCSEDVDTDTDTNTDTLASLSCSIDEIASWNGSNWICDEIYEISREEYDNLVAFVSDELCPSGQYICNGDCVDLSMDTDNCGICGNECAQDQTCYSGACILPVCGDGIIHPPHETCDDGNFSSGDGCSSTCLVEPGAHCVGLPSMCGRIAFQTAGIYYPSDFSDITGADYLCNLEAQFWGFLNDEFKAWISSETVNAIDRHSTYSTLKIIDINGNIIAQNNMDLVDGSLNNLLNQTPYGAYTADVWTGTQSSGSVVLGNTCNDWSDNNGNGAYGRSDMTNSSWTYSGIDPCNMQKNLYCIMDQ